MTAASDQRGFETRAIHVGQEPDPATGAVVPPISVSTTFAQIGVARHRGWEYARSGNPTRAALERCIASLEGARHGLAFASGLAAEDAVLRQVPPGGGIALGGDAYGGTFRLIDKVYGASGHPWTAVDLTDPAGLDRDWPAGTKVVWAETPTNPAMAIVDIAAVAEVAHAHGAWLVVDNTFATPYLQQPLSLGADVVVHSSTKYLGGHSDVVGGAVAVNDDDLARAPVHAERGRRRALPGRLLPRAAGPQDAGRTHGPALRQRPGGRQMLVGHPAVDRVLWPGCPTTPATTSPSTRCGTSGHGVLRPPGRGGGGGAGVRAPRCSRSPSR